MKLPAHTDLSVEAVHAIATRHAFQVTTITRLPDTGIFNAIYLLGQDLVLRVPRQHPAHIDALYREAIVVPVARAVGVRTPALIAFDDTCNLVPVPYTLYERVHGETLGLLDLEPAETPETWRELGRDLARLHMSIQADDLRGELAHEEPLPDPRVRAEELATDGYFTSSAARWLVGWLEHLALSALVPVPHRIVHGDVQATNVMVEPENHRYRAIIDWGSAGWADATHDFAAVPLRGVPLLLQGHREIAPLDRDDTAEARILWRYLQLALLIMPRQLDPLRSWAERPWALWLEVLRFFAGPLNRSWAALAPPSRYP